MKLILGSVLLLAALGCGGDKSETGGDTASGFAKLAPADRALAEAQKVCPVSGKPLGSMGKPVRMEQGGAVAFLCCEGCRKTFEADPAKYLAKVRK